MPIPLSKCLNRSSPPVASSAAKDAAASPNVTAAPPPPKTSISKCFSSKAKSTPSVPGKGQGQEATSQQSPNGVQFANQVPSGGGGGGGGGVPNQNPVVPSAKSPKFAIHRTSSSLKTAKKIPPLSAKGPQGTILPQSPNQGQIPPRGGVFPNNIPTSPKSPNYGQPPGKQSPNQGQIPQTGGCCPKKIPTSPQSPNYGQSPLNPSPSRKPDWVSSPGRSKRCSRCPSPNSSLTTPRSSLRKRRQCCSRTGSPGSKGQSPRHFHLYRPWTGYVSPSDFAEPELPHNTAWRTSPGGPPKASRVQNFKPKPIILQVSSKSIQTSPGTSLSGSRSPQKNSCFPFPFAQTQSQDSQTSPHFWVYDPEKYRITPLESPSELSRRTSPSRCERDLNPSPYKAAIERVKSKMQPKPRPPRLCEIPTQTQEDSFSSPSRLARLCATPTKTRGSPKRSPRMPATNPIKCPAQQFDPQQNPQILVADHVQSATIRMPSPSKSPTSLPGQDESSSRPASHSETSCFPFSRTQKDSSPHRSVGAPVICSIVQTISLPDSPRISPGRGDSPPSASANSCFSLARTPKDSHLIPQISTVTNNKQSGETPKPVLSPSKSPAALPLRVQSPKRLAGSCFPFVRSLKHSGSSPPTTLPGPQELKRIYDFRPPEISSATTSTSSESFRSSPKHGQELLRSRSQIRSARTSHSTSTSPRPPAPRISMTEDDMLWKFERHSLSKPPDGSPEIFSSSDQRPTSSESPSSSQCCPPLDRTTSGATPSAFPASEVPSPASRSWLSKAPHSDTTRTANLEVQHPKPGRVRRFWDSLWNRSTNQGSEGGRLPDLASPKGLANLPYIKDERWIQCFDFRAVFIFGFNVGIVLFLTYIVDLLHDRKHGSDSTKNSNCITVEDWFSPSDMQTPKCCDHNAYQYTSTSGKPPLCNVAIYQ